MSRAKRFQSISILVGLLLIAWQCFYVIDWEFDSDKIDRHINRTIFYGENARIRNTSEFHELMNQLNGEDDLTIDDETPYKKILFWNEGN